MKASLVAILACPECRGPLTFQGVCTRRRLFNGELECSKGHIFHVKDGIPILKESKLSGNEFSWKAKVSIMKRYERIRRQYRSYLSESLNRADDLLIEEIARRVPRRGVILDLASGMGTLLLAMSKHSGDAQILGTDVDEIPLRGAMLKLKERRSYGRVSLCVMDAKHLALMPGKVTIAVSHFGFNNIPRTSEALTEVSRVLRARSKLVFSALSLRKNSRSYRLAEKLGYGQVATESALVATLERLGFRIDSIESFYSGEWPQNPMDRLPMEGDWFAHLLVRAHAK